MATEVTALLAQVRVRYRPKGGHKCSRCHKEGHKITTCAWREKLATCPGCASQRTRTEGNGSRCYACGVWWDPTHEGGRS